MPVLKFKLNPEFRGRAARAIKWLPALAARLPARMRVAPGKAIVGAFAGWGAVILAGGVLMAHVSQDNCCVVSAPAVAVVEPPKATVAVAAPKTEAVPVAEPVAAPAPAPVAAKTTQRVDMTPTASIAEPPAKPKHKPHKKKPKDL